MLSSSYFFIDPIEQPVLDAQGSWDSIEQGPVLGEPVEERMLLSTSPILVVEGEPTLETYGWHTVQPEIRKAGAFAGEASGWGLLGCSAGPWASSHPSLPIEAGFVYAGSDITINTEPGGWGDWGDPVDIRLHAWSFSHSQLNGASASAEYTYSISASQGVGTIIEGHHIGYWPAGTTDENEVILHTTIGTPFTVDIHSEGHVQVTSEPWVPGPVGPDQAIIFAYTLDLQIEVQRPSLDIEMLSATTEDSQSVTFEYEITGEGIDQFQVGIYRSADDQFDPADVPMVDLFTITDTSPGTHTYTKQNIDLSPDPKHKYVFVVADPGEEIEETDDENNEKSFYKYLLGIVTHGAVLPGTFPNWVAPMAAALIDEGYDDAQPKYWVDSSRMPEREQAVAAGQLFAGDVARTVRDLSLSPNDVVDVHWIGHSRGAVVISEALKSLAGVWSQIPEQLQHGYIKMTMLDPHPARNDPDFPGGVRCSWNPIARLNVGWFNYLAVLLFQRRAKDPKPIVSGIVDEAEVYYQETKWHEMPFLSDEWTLNLWGETVDGARNDDRWSQPGIGHNEIVTQYQATLSPTSSTSAQSAGFSAGEDSYSDIDYLYPDLVDDYDVAEAIASELEAARSAYENGNLQVMKASLEQLMETIEANREHIDSDTAELFLWQATIIVDFGTGSEAKIDVSVTFDPVATDANGEVSTLPNNEEWIDEWSSFWVEIWVSTPDTDATGVVSAQVDLTYNTDYFTATGIEYGPGFDLLQIGTIDDATGVVDDLGAGTSATDVGDDQYALLARVRFEPAVDGPGVPLGADGKYITPVDNGFGLDDAEVSLVGHIAADVELGTPPDTELWPVMYDIDDRFNDNGLIDFGDFTFFAQAFAQDVEDGSLWNVWASDFDRSGLVDFGDFTFFAMNFGKGKTDGIEIRYPGNFPGDWRSNPLTLEVPLSPPQGSAALVTDQKLDPIVSEAIHRLKVSEGSEAKVILENVRVEIVDLPDNRLGQSLDNRVWIDLDAAGYGWFIDATPGDEVEFSRRTGTDELMATLDSPVRGRVDLLTTLMHEFGHVLGYEHSANDDAMLPLSTRRLLGEESLFSSDEEDADDFWDDQDLNAEVLDEVFRRLGT